MFLGMNSNQFIVCIIASITNNCYLSKNLIGDRIQMYFLIIVYINYSCVPYGKYKFFFINKESFSNLIICH